jgi:hypothetical protein
LWWDHSNAYWVPKNEDNKIILKRIGYSYCYEDYKKSKKYNNIHKTAISESKFYHIGRPGLLKLSPGQEGKVLTESGDWSKKYYLVWPIFISVGEPQMWYVEDSLYGNNFSVYEIDGSNLDEGKMMADLPSLVDKGMYYEEGLAWWERGDEPELLKQYLSENGDIPIPDLLKLWEVTSSITGSLAYVGDIIPTREIPINKEFYNHIAESSKKVSMNKYNHFVEANEMVLTDPLPIQENHLDQLSDSDWNQINDMGVSENFDWRGPEDTKRIFYKLLGRSGKIDQYSFPDHYEFFTSVFGAIPEGENGIFNIFQEAKKQFPVTDDIYSAGYILPDGSLLDFSGSHERGGNPGIRAYDHRQIHSVVSESVIENFIERNPQYDDKRDEPDFPMVVFKDLGAIRCNFSNKYANLDISQPPTSAQYRVIISTIGALDNIDIEMSHGGNSIPEKSISYGSSSFDYDITRINGTKIVNDIRKFYEGEKEFFSENIVT